MKKFSSRKLTDNEISYIYFKEVANPFFDIFMECEKIYNINIIEKSINETLEHFIELNSKIINKKYVYKKRYVKIEVIENKFNGYNFEVLKDENIDYDKVLKVKCINKKFLIFSFNHSFVDGKGAFMFIKTFMQIINKQEIEINTNCYIGDIEFTKGLPENREKRKLFYNNTLQKRSANKTNEVYYKRLTLHKNIPFILAKVISILSKYFKNSNLTFLIPSDIRNLNKEIISISNLTEPLYLRCRKNEDWFNISNKIYKNVKKHKNINKKNMEYGIILKIHPKLFSFIINFSSYIEKMTNSFFTAGSITDIISNIDKFSSSNLTVNSVFMKPFYQPLLPLAIEIVEQKDKIEIVFSSNTNYIDYKTAKEILDNIKRLED